MMVCVLCYIFMYDDMNICRCKIGQQLELDVFPLRQLGNHEIQLHNLNGTKWRNYG